MDGLYARQPGKVVAVTPECRPSPGRLAQYRRMPRPDDVGAAWPLPRVVPAHSGHMCQRLLTGTGTAREEDTAVVHWQR